MKLKMMTYATVAAISFLATLALLVAITGGRPDRRAVQPWPTVCANGTCTYATPTPWPTYLPATAEAIATFYAATWATNQAATPAPADAVDY